MKKPVILVTGADGQLGRSLKVVSGGYPSFQWVFQTKKELSIDDPEAIRSFFEKYKPSFCINCAAYTAVDRAESDQALAYRINAESVGHLAAACKSFGTRFIHISTDYVFDGESSRPLKEEDTTGPINVYGQSKRKGEELALAFNPDALIIRTAWVYSEFGNNFLKTMIRLMRERESVNVVNDQVGSPTYALDLAGAIALICSFENFLPGIYHYCNAGRITWFDFAVEIRDLTNSSCRVLPIPSSQYPTPARRPRFSLLDTSKIQSVYKISIPHWRESLVKCLENLQQGV